MNDYVEVKSFGKITPQKGANPRNPYEHQKAAMENLNIINQNERYSTLVVLPTGGGKTFTASLWLLKNALDKKKKILWIAHRQMLLDQALNSFQKYAYPETIPHISSFNYRIVSGFPKHDKPIHIKPEDDLLIASKDSLVHNLNFLDKWLFGEYEIFLIIDEAHHATAKTYRKIIDYVKSKVPNVKLIGLTATPIRTSDQEKGLLAKIFEDGVKGNGKSKKSVHKDVGISYQIGLKELISRQILSQPKLETHYTDQLFGEKLGIDELERIQHFDKLPDNIKKAMESNAVRNKFIVEKYIENQKEYGQTIVFALSIVNAIQLAKQFNMAGIKADYVVSSVKDAETGVTRKEDNERILEEFRKGKLQVLVNVDILTEGVDLPQTKTVFLTRPTVSTILMTQMVGRALRGVAAGGTAEANIVSFVDKWDSYIEWTNPNTLFDGDNDFAENETDRVKREIRLIGISKIEEFAKILDESIDTTDLERIPFIQRIPVGMYIFTYLEKDDIDEGMDCTYQVMVYDSTEKSYKKFIASLPKIFKTFECENEEYPDNSLLKEIAKYCEEKYFLGDMIPPYEEKDIIKILKYFAQKGEPAFYPFDKINRERLDVSRIAKKIFDEGLGGIKKRDYQDSIWENSDENLLRLFFPNKISFLRQLSLELEKLENPECYAQKETNNVDYGTRNLEYLSLYDIEKVNPQYAKKLRENTFAKFKTKKGGYKCARCGKEFSNRLYLQIDHIVPMSKGGKSVLENLQILCRKCNGEKGDKID